MSLSSLPFPWQQKEETRLRAQVSDHWAGWAVGSPLGLQGHWARAGLYHPLKSHWELATLSPAGGCGVHEVTMRHSRVWAFQN